MHEAVPEEDFLALLMDTIWFPETVDLCFSGEYEPAYHGVIENFMRRGIVKRRKGNLVTSVKP